MRPDQRDDADDQAHDAGAPELMNVTGELMADQRDLVRDRVQDLPPQLRVARRDQAQDGHQDEQQREQRHKPRVREVGGKHPAVVITVFLDHPEHERGRLVTLLRRVHPADYPSIGFIRDDRPSRALLPPRCPAAPTANQALLNAASIPWINPDFAPRSHRAP